MTTNQTEQKAESINWRGVIDCLLPGESFTLRWKHNGNPNLRIEFRNGWGASLIWDGPGFMQEWAEVAVSEGMNGSLSYDTPVTNDVIGYLGKDALLSVLHQIRVLPDRPYDEDEEA